MDVWEYLKILCILMIGFLIGAVMINYMPENTVFLLPFSSMEMPSKSSPYNHIPEQNIKVFSDRVIIGLEGKEVSWSSFADTKSMEPVLNKHSNGIEVMPENPEQIQVGDIISYEHLETGDLIIHRVISKGEDENGTFFTTKGDNVPIRDQEKVRFSQIRGLLVAVIY